MWRQNGIVKKISELFTENFIVHDIALNIQENGISWRKNNNRESINTNLIRLNINLIRKNANLIGKSVNLLEKNTNLVRKMWISLGKLKTRQCVDFFLNYFIVFFGLNHWSGDFEKKNLKYSNFNCFTFRDSINNTK